MIALVLKRPLTSALAVLLAGVLTFAAVQAERARRATERARTAEAAAVEAGRRADLNATATRVVDRTHLITRRLEEEADAEARVLAEDPRGEAPIDPALLDDWRRALDRLREGAADPGAAGPGEFARAVPPA